MQNLLCVRFRFFSSLLVLLSLLGVGCDLSSSSPLDIAGFNEASSEEAQADLAEAVEEFDADPEVADSSSNPAANASEAFFSGLRWLRSDPSAPNARVTKNLGNLSIRGNNVFFTMDDLGDWPNRGDAYGVMAMAVNRGGTWEGGKFDHVRRDTRERNFNNIRGYLPVFPVSGEPVRFWVINYPGTEASNYVETTWP